MYRHPNFLDPEYIDYLILQGSYYDLQRLGLPLTDDRFTLWQNYHRGLYSHLLHPSLLFGDNRQYRGSLIGPIADFINFNGSPQERAMLGIPPNIDPDMAKLISQAGMFPFYPAERTWIAPPRAYAYAEPRSRDEYDSGADGLIVLIIACVLIFGGIQLFGFVEHLVGPPPLVVTVVADHTHGNPMPGKQNVRIMVTGAPPGSTLELSDTFYHDGIKDDFHQWHWNYPLTADVGRHGRATISITGLPCAHASWLISDDYRSVTHDFQATAGDRSGSVEYGC